MMTFVLFGKRVQHFSSSILLVKSYVYICCLCMFFFQGGNCFDQWKLEKKTTTQRRHFDKLDKVLRCLDWWQVIPLMASRNPAG